MSSSAHGERVSRKPIAATLPGAASSNVLPTSSAISIASGGERKSGLPALCSAVPAGTSCERRSATSGPSPSFGGCSKGIAGRCNATLRSWKPMVPAMKPCRCGVTNPSRFVISRCPRCSLIDLAPMTGSERERNRAKREERTRYLAQARKVTIALRDTTADDYAEIRARSLGQRELYRAYRKPV